MGVSDFVPINDKLKNPIDCTSVLCKVRATVAEW